MAKVEANQGLKASHSFDRLVIGPNNHVAVAACQEVIKTPGETYNPLYIYGPSGVGKTHLMQAVALEMLKKDPALKIRYLSAERFANDVVIAISEDRLVDLRREYGQLNLFVLDDVQYLVESKAAQEELFHIFNILQEQNHQVILAADRPPSQLTSLSKNIRSRFEWGLSTDVQIPDEKTRYEILKLKQEIQAIHLTESMMTYVAHHLNSNVRELEGFLKRMHAYINLSHQELTDDLVKAVVNEIAPEGAGVVDETPAAPPAPKSANGKAPAAPPKPPKQEIQDIEPAGGQNGHHKNGSPLKETPVHREPVAAKEPPPVKEPPAKEHAPHKSSPAPSDDIDAMFKAAASAEPTAKKTDSKPPEKKKKEESTADFGSLVDSISLEDTHPSKPADKPAKQEKKKSEPPPTSESFGSLVDAIKFEPPAAPTPPAAKPPKKIQVPESALASTPLPPEPPATPAMEPAEPADAAEAPPEDEDVPNGYKEIGAVFFFPEGQENALETVHQKFQEVVKKHKLKFRLKRVNNHPYAFKGKINYTAFVDVCKANKVPVAIVIGPPPEALLSEHDFHDLLTVTLDVQGVSLQLVNWGEINKDYRYLNLALDIALVRSR